MTTPALTIGGAGRQAERVADAFVCAYAVVRNATGEILLAHRTDRDMWNLPGGGVERDESPWAAVVREVREEVGLEVEPLRLLAVAWQPPAPMLVLDFECKAVGGALARTDEADDFAYLPLTPCPRTCSPCRWSD